MKRSIPWLILVAMFVLTKPSLWDLYYIPSRSMTPAIIPGDVVVMSRWAYEKSQAAGLLSSWVSGVPTRGDVMLFRWPVGDTVVAKFPKHSYYDLIRANGRDNVVEHPEVYGEIRTYETAQKEVFIKRCVALPGDSVQLIQNEVLLNEAMDLSYYDWGSRGYIRETREGKTVLLEGDELFFPHVEIYQWNYGYWGPMYVPRKGDVLPLDSISLPLYRRLIEVYEDNRLEVLNHQIYLNGQLTDQYTVQQNYYFVLGDNPIESEDSRFWGLVPEDHLIGKASMILGSMEGGKVKWNRWFKAL